MILSVVAIIFGGLASGCSEKAPRPAAAETPARPPQVREPAVAGLFYPKDPAELSGELDAMLKAAPAPGLANVKAIVAPHAGYPYSGPVAAAAYRAVAGGGFKTVVVLAPSHYAHFQGASVSAADSFRTPLGSIPAADLAKRLAASPPFLREPRCLVQRPSWSSQASHPPPPRGEDTPETWEHAGEVQFPFLQKVLEDFRLVSVICGEVDPGEAARALAGLIGEDTLIVASSDLSHYYPYQEARGLDRRCVQAICDLDLGSLASQEACGRTPIQVVVHLARQRGWKTQLLDCRNSGDTAGDKSRVVGYASIAFYAPGAAAGAPAGEASQPAYGAEERRFLLNLARQTLQAAAAHTNLPEPRPEKLTARLQEPRGCFVTLTADGALRGCIGHIVAQEALYRAVMDNARNAALRDPRFPPVQPGEVPGLEIEISVLTPPRPLEFASPEELLQKLQPHRDGVVLTVGNRQATYLPQVWEQLPDKTRFLDSLAQKAGCEAGAWRRPGATIALYRVEAFKESEAGGKPGSSSRRK